MAPFFCLYLERKLETIPNTFSRDGLEMELFLVLARRKI